MPSHTQVIPSALPILLFTLPGALGILILAFGRRQPLFRGVLTGLGLAGTLAVVAACAPAVLNGQVLVAWRNTLRIDGLGLLVQGLGTLLTCLVAIYSTAYADHSPKMGDFGSGRRGLYYGLLLLFLGTMNWTCSTNNIIMLWVSLEATTLAMTFLVTFYWKRESIEAGYKYLMLVAVGMTFALFGCVLIYSGALRYIQPSEALLFTGIGKVAGQIPLNVVLLAAALLIAGFGTKAGLLPFHAWVPDAHSEAPSPVSALLSGIVLKVGAYALARTVTPFAAGTPAIVVFVAILASLGMVIAIFMAWAQDDLKRLLAFHSVSQMGYVIEGLGMGTYLGIYGGLFHLVNHTLFKSLLFLSVGGIMYATGGVRRMSQLGGLGRYMPLTAFCFFVGAIAMGGLPPFNGFWSKFTLFAAVADRRLMWAAVVSMVTGLLTLACMVHAGYKTFWGEPRAAQTANPGLREVPARMWVPMVILAGLCLLLGVYPKLIYPALDVAARCILGMLTGG